MTKNRLGLDCKIHFLFVKNLKSAFISVGRIAVFSEITD